MRHDGSGAQGRQVLNSVGDRWAAVGGGERRSVELVDLRHHGFFQIHARFRTLPLLSAQLPPHVLRRPAARSARSQQRAAHHST